MASITFDTHAYVKKLKAAGFTEQQAEVQAEALVDLVENRLATKQDLKELEVALRHDLKELELRLTIRLGALIAGAIALVAALVKLL
ncbi:MAG: DUF1640 domain-containing protein [Desulfobulbaceae bacterium]|nr:DUF1640 domain-containing protein [Desulfobulbaceae bacterium]